MLSSKTFQDRRVLITGGGTGLGLAMSLAFARAGASVTIASRSTATRQAGIEMLATYGLVADDIFLDVTDVDCIESVFAAERYDVLVNNAAANFFAMSDDVSTGGYHAIADRVLKGTFFCSSRFAASAIADGRGGAILNIVTTTGIDGGPGVAVSAAVKAGVINLTKSHAVEWARDGIRVNALAPGIFPHEDDAAGTTRLHFNTEAIEAVPIGRAGRPEEIGWLATYLCSPYAGYINGQTVVIDGGLSLPSDLVKRPFRPIRAQLPARER